MELLLLALFLVVVCVLLDVVFTTSLFARWIWGGWRYIFSQHYRSRTRERWRDSLRTRVATEIIGYGIGVLLSSALVAQACWDLLQVIYQ